MMRIDKVYYLSLERNIARHYAQRACANMMGIPVDKLVRDIGYLGETFDSVLDVAAGMVDDGFPEFSWFLESKNADSIWQKPKNLCVSWSHLRILRQIVANGENAIVLEDDTFLKYDFGALQTDIFNLSVPFDVIFLGIFRFSNKSRHQHYDIREDLFLQERFQAEIKSTNIDYIYSNFWGLGSRARLFSAAGADKFLQSSLDNPWYSSELVLWYESKKGFDRSRILFCNPSPVHTVPDSIQHLVF